MLNINPIGLSQFTLAILYQFFTKLTALIERIGPDKLKIEPIYKGLLLPAFNKLDVAYKKDKGSKHTGTMSELDKLRDSITSAILGIIDAMLKSSNPEVAAAAKRLKFLFKKFKGINQRQRDAQTADTTNLLQELEGEYADDVEKLGLGTWVTELKDVNTKMNTSSDERTQEKADKSKADAATAKKGIIEVYRTMCKQVEVNMMMEGAANYEDFVRNLNVIIGEAGGTSKTAGEVALEEDKYPDAKEWEEDLPFMGVENGDIYYILVDGKKVFYKLIDKQKFFWHPESEKAAGGWEKLN